MFRRIAIILCALGMSLLACSAPGAASPPTPSPQVVVVTATLLPATSVPQGVPTSAPTANLSTPQPPSGGGGPHFTAEIKFSTDPNPATATRTFKAATQRIYGMWGYSGMASGLIVRREWYLDGQLWLKREEPWNFKTYAASGMVTDVSIYDLEHGLPSGHYELRLYIDGKPQFAGDSDLNFRTFDIGPGPGLSSGPDVGGAMSPDGTLNALVENGGTLRIQNESGQNREVVKVAAIDGISWLPDSLHIAYSTRQAGASGSPLDVTYDLWIVNVNTGGTTKLSQPGENLHRPIVSPDGQYIAVLAGTGYGDACGIDLVTDIMLIDPVEISRHSLYLMGQFSGVAQPVSGSTAYSVEGPDFGLPGRWVSPTQLRVGIRYTCTDGSNDAIYVLDLSTITAQKIGPLGTP